MRHERQADESARERKEQLEISGVGRIAECHFDAIVAPRDLHLMRRGIRIAELGGAVDLQAEAAGRSLPIAIAEVAEAPRIARPIEQLRVFERDLSRLAGIDREDARANESLSRQLDQRRVTFLAYDCFVDGTRLRSVHGLAAQLLVTLPEGIAREDRFAGQRKVIHAFFQHRTVVAEPLLNADPRHPSRDADLPGAAQPLRCQDEVLFRGRSAGALRHLLALTPGARSVRMRRRTDERRIDHWRTGPARVTDGPLQFLDRAAGRQRVVERATRADRAQLQAVFLQLTGELARGVLVGCVIDGNLDGDVFQHHNRLQTFKIGLNYKWGTF